VALIGEETPPAPDGHYSQHAAVPASACDELYFSRVELSKQGFLCAMP
jgi:hypothetical protein